MQGQVGKIIFNAIHGLTPEHAELVRWRYRDEMTFDEIAQRKGVSKAAVHSMHARAMQRLRTSLMLMGVNELRELL